MNTHVIEITATIIVAVLGSNGLWSIINNYLMKKNALAIGLQAILRDKILENCRKYLAQGFLPIEERTSLEKMFKAYEKLGGNDVAHQAYLDSMNLPYNEKEDTK